LDEDRFQQFWLRLEQTINPNEDQVVSYTLDAANARRRKSAGSLAIVSNKRSHYVL
jgi:hypothetical protein